MPRSEHHPLALFSLQPLNERAVAVLAHSNNERLTSWVKPGESVLDIGHFRSISGDDVTLATLGRNGDIELAGSSIAKIQCSFEINWDTIVVMFYDRSHNQTSQVFGPVATPFEYGRARKVVVQDNVNTIIGMGGVGRDLYLFELIWHHNPAGTMEEIENRASAIHGYEENSRLAQTVDETDTVLPSQRQTRLHTGGIQQLKLRYATIIEFGRGQFGTVHKAVDVDSGKLLAVKTLTRPGGATEQEWRAQLHNNLRREVDILSRISHPHIVDYIGSRGLNEGDFEIFMGLKEGTLQSLVRGGCSIPIRVLSSTVLHHVLQAIDFLATKGIVHRDIKPENVLYVSRSGQFHFQLGDFGLSNFQSFATTFAGSMLYMAPEIFLNGEQTHKADVWSLYVTMLWSLDVRDFRAASSRFTNPDVARATILSSTAVVQEIQEMARPEPNKRASAAQMLVKCFKGQGLTTPRNQVPPLIEPVEADSKAPARPVSAPTEERDLRRNAEPPAAAGQPRVEKDRPAQAQPRQLVGPGTEKRPGQLGLSTLMEARMPGAFPTDVVDTSAEARRRPSFA